MEKTCVCDRQGLFLLSPFVCSRVMGVGGERQLLERVRTFISSLFSESVCEIALETNQLNIDLLQVDFESCGFSK